MKTNGCLNHVEVYNDDNSRPKTLGSKNGIMKWDEVFCFFLVAHSVLVSSSNMASRHHPGCL